MGIVVIERGREAKRGREGGRREGGRGRVGEREGGERGGS